MLDVLPKIETRLLYLDHFVERGRDLYDLACERDLEGIVGKWSRGSYQSDGRSTSWLKIKNPKYTQALGRRELFERGAIAGNDGKATERRNYGSPEGRRLRRRCATTSLRRRLPHPPRRCVTEHPGTRPPPR